MSVYTSSTQASGCVPCESHYLFGRRYRLRIVDDGQVSTIVVRGRSVIEMHGPRAMDEAARERTLQRWYRQQLKAVVPTKWGSCNPDSRRIWLNLELAKKPVQCLEYILVHELVHLIERRHNDRFVSLMDEHLPHWRLVRAELNAAPLAHETWSD